MAGIQNAKSRIDSFDDLFQFIGGSGAFQIAHIFIMSKLFTTPRNRRKIVQGCLQSALSESDD